ncbi:MAG: A/G-specific adenine glycosylase [Rudaea sp.]
MRSAADSADDFATRLLGWYERSGRKDLPWQHPRSAYSVWLSEIMLQQTQVATVIPYFRRFVDALPTLPALAASNLDDVFALWSGLGYYSRARNLHRAARICVAEHQGELPPDFAALVALPGIGRSTAGAILSQAWGLRFPILDGNVKRVLARRHGVRGWPGDSGIEKELWKFAELHTPSERVADYTQAIMDLGATICTRARPRCDACPVSADCAAFHAGLTGELPQRRVARPLPTRSTLMVVLRDRAGRLLLERRAPTGIWAGLWSLPEAADEASARADVANRHGMHQQGGFALLPEFRHAFTHFRLAVQPVVLEVEPIPRSADDDTHRWLLPAEAAALGLPAPVRKLIANL